MTRTELVASYPSAPSQHPFSFRTWRHVPRSSNPLHEPTPSVPSTVNSRYRDSSDPLQGSVATETTRSVGGGYDHRRS